MLGARRGRPGCCRGTASTGRRRPPLVLGGARRGRAARCCTSPSGTCRARADPFLVKAPGLWAEHTLRRPDASSGRSANETYATALDDPDDALGRAYGVPTRGGVRPRVVRHRAGRRACPTATTRSASSTGSIELAGGPLRADRGAGAALAPLGRRRSARSTVPPTRTPTPGCGRRSRSPTARSPTGCSPRTAGAHGRPRVPSVHRSAPAAAARSTHAGAATNPTSSADAAASQSAGTAAPPRGRGRWRTAPPAKALHPAASASPMVVAVVVALVGARRGGRRLVMSIVSVDIATRSVTCCLRGEELLERRLAVRQLGLDAHDRRRRRRPLA